MLELKAIQKSFGSHQVFSIDSLVLPTGIYWLKGANGSGKSTLMKLIAGLLPFKGDILLNETINIRKHPVNFRLLVNHAPAEPQYPSFLSGTEIIDFVTAIKKGHPEKTEQHKELLGVDDYLSNPTGSYSSGMLKKLSLLVAFTGQPSWILLDEPFTTLDHASQEALCQLIKTKHEQGISFLVTSHHDLETVQLEFTRAFLLKDKQLQELTNHL